MKTTWLLGIGVFLSVGYAVMLPQAEAADGSQPAGHEMQAVEDDVHEFMEYAVEPFFKQLKSSLKEPPKNKRAWVSVKANSLILAENGNLLMLRGPQKEVAQWNTLAAALRDQGQLLYYAAKKRDFGTSKKHYVNFVTKCNACHEKFADGEHIQKP